LQDATAKLSKKYSKSPKIISDVSLPAHQLSEKTPLLNRGEGVSSIRNPRTDKPKFINYDLPLRVV